MRSWLVISLAVGAVIGSVSGSVSGSVRAQTTSKTLATVNGEVINEDQVVKVAAADLATLESKKAQSPATYDRDKLVIMHKALDSIIEDKLIAAEAARDHVSREQVIVAEIDSNVSIPTPEEIEEFYQ